MTGDTFHMSGDFRGSNVNINSTLTNVRQTIDHLPVDPATKDELQSLIEQLNEILQKAPPEKAEEAEAVALQAQELVDKAKQDKPNKTLLRSAGETFKRAAEALATVAPPALTIATQIVTLISKLHGL